MPAGRLIPPATQVYGRITAPLQRADLLLWTAVFPRQHDVIGVHVYVYAVYARV